MAYRVRTVRDAEELRSALGGIGHYFGWVPTEEDAEQFGRVLPHDRMYAALDGDAIVAGAGSFPLELTLPAGPVPCAGVTVVGVLPSHRRRGLLRRMMDVQLRDVRERDEPLAALWASEPLRFFSSHFSSGLRSRASKSAAQQRSMRRMESSSRRPARILAARRMCLRSRRNSARSIAGLKRCNAAAMRLAWTRAW